MNLIQEFDKAWNKKFKYILAEPPTVKSFCHRWLKKAANLRQEPKSVERVKTNLRQPDKEKIGKMAEFLYDNFNYSVWDNPLSYKAYCKQNKELNGVNFYRQKAKELLKEIYATK